MKYAVYAPKPMTVVKIKMKDDEHGATVLKENENKFMDDVWVILLD